MICLREWHSHYERIDNQRSATGDCQWNYDSYFTDISGDARRRNKSPPVVWRHSSGTKSNREWEGGFNPDKYWILCNLLRYVMRLSSFALKKNVSVLSDEAEIINDTINSYSRVILHKVFRRVKGKLAGNRTFEFPCIFFAQRKIFLPRNVAMYVNKRELKNFN